MALEQYWLNASSNGIKRERGSGLTLNPSNCLSRALGEVPSGVMMTA
jgi:hypothetical protein